MSDTSPLNGQATDQNLSTSQRALAAARLVRELAPDAARLSSRQRDILRRLLAASVCQPGENEPVPPCISIKALRGPGPKSAADSAAFSRAVRRLARRGLVIPCNLNHGVRSGPNTGKVRIDATDKNTRATHLLLTPLGRAIASRIAPSAAAEPQMVPSPSATAAPATVPTPPAPDSGRKCHRCDQKALPGSRFCESCYRTLKVLSPLWDG